jgi:hypothetical protein
VSRHRRYRLVASIFWTHPGSGLAYLTVVDGERQMLALLCLARRLFERLADVAERRRVDLVAGEQLSDGKHLELLLC